MLNKIFLETKLPSARNAKKNPRMVSGQKIVTLHTVILWSTKPVKLNFGLSNATFMWLGFAEKAIKLSQEQKGPNLEKSWDLFPL